MTTPQSAGDAIRAAAKRQQDQQIAAVKASLKASEELDAERERNEAPGATE